MHTCEKYARFCTQDLEVFGHLFQILKEIKLKLANNMQVDGAYSKNLLVLKKLSLVEKYWGACTYQCVELLGQLLFTLYVFKIFKPAIAPIPLKSKDHFSWFVAMKIVSAQILNCITFMHRNIALRSKFMQHNNEYSAFMTLELWRL